MSGIANAAKKKSWSGAAEIIEVTDGDTFEALIDLGFGVMKRTKVRVAGVQAPEMDTSAGLTSKYYLEKLLPRGSVVTLLSRRLDKYGRAEAVVVLDDQRDLAQLLITSHMAQPADGSGHIK